MYLTNKKTKENWNPRLTDITEKKKEKTNDILRVYFFFLECLDPFLFYDSAFFFFYLQGLRVATPTRRLGCRLREVGRDLVFN